MKRPFIAALLSLLGPGLGQLYNKEYKQGAFLLAITTILFIVPSVWLVQRVLPLLPDPAQQLISPEDIQTAVAKAAGANRHYLSLVSFMFMALWAYSITQAYFKGKEIEEKAAKGEQAPPET